MFRASCFGLRDYKTGSGQDPPPPPSRTGLRPRLPKPASLPSTCRRHVRGLGAEGGPRPLPGADRRLWGQDVRRGRPVLPAAARGCSRDGPPELGGGAIPPRTPTPSPRRGTPRPHPSTLCLWAGPCRTLRTGGPTRQASFTAWPLRSLCRRLVHAGLGPASPLSGLRELAVLTIPGVRPSAWTRGPPRLPCAKGPR